MKHEDGLRSWAKGMYTYEAATELLIRAFGGRYADPQQPWIRTDDDSGKPWIDFESIPELIGGSSSGERSILMLAASIAADVPIALGDTVSGLDRDNLQLVLATPAHTGGSHEHSDVRTGDDGAMVFHGKLDSLYPWPRTLRSV